MPLPPPLLSLLEPRHCCSATAATAAATAATAAAATAAGVEVARSEVRLPEGPIRVVGEHTVEFHLHTDVSVEVPVQVEAEE